LLSNLGLFLTSTADPAPSISPTIQLLLGHPLTYYNLNLADLDLYKFFLSQ
jgi:hypothetical protein